MLVHTVLFWLRQDLSDADRRAFREGLETLVEIETAEDVLIGTPADTESRPVVDKTFDFMLTTVFAGQTEHDAYQAHPIHRAFVENHGSQWERLIVYDAD